MAIWQIGRVKDTAISLIMLFPLQVKLKGLFNKEQLDQVLKLLKSNSSSGIPSGSLAQTGKGKIKFQKVRGWNSGRMIGSARMIDNLYYFDDYCSTNKTAQCFSGISSSSVRDQIMFWHHRLGHPSFSYIKYLFPNLFKNLNCSSFQCESCVFI
ncbi:uncharacterized protein LOC128285579 [Gossypium arboreum]|uniref:uncharacterized protein LOC128285579 n=1 Tax=Gossypium arboreum TaxID=29729 RepID=UPI0022F16A6B|nr:uncharacterized protein LOC128285579 [Gossypium arboreum]